jgi:predicted ester cyclase
MPDLQLVAEDLIGEADRVAARFQLGGTNSQPYQVRPASKGPVDVLANCVYRLVRGAGRNSLWTMT